MMGNASAETKAVLGEVKQSVKAAAKLAYTRSRIGRLTARRAKRI